MTPLWPLVAFLAVVAVGTVAGALWRRYRADSRPYPKCDGYDLDADGIAHTCTVLKCDGYDLDADGIAHTCTVLVGHHTGHRVAVVEDFAEDGIIGGVGNVGVYCGRHCPGSCTNPHCRLVRHHA